MELKLRSVFGVSVVVTVLIVPFMELKQVLRSLNHDYYDGLNRTFYGIETRLRQRFTNSLLSLNRTFYGIETTATSAA